MSKFLYSLCLLLFSLTIFADPTPHQPMPVDQAFAFSAKTFGNDTLVVQWKIAPKHYLYRERIQYKILEPKNAAIGSVLLPLGALKEDAIFGRYQVFANNVTIPLPIINPNPTNTQLQITYQGCAEDGYCYPPKTKQIAINFNAGTAAVSNANLNVISPPTGPSPGQEKKILALLSDPHSITALFAFLGFGILLSFTPCVLPMLPIISGIIVGQQKTITMGKAFRLSLVYVLGMAITYAIAGVLIGIIGGSVQAAFQKPWVLILFSLLFVLLALSFFGLYQIKLPARFEEKIANISRHQKSGHYIGVAIMGCLASLIVSPCVTPALVGVLTYIGQTGNALFGGLTLFMLGLGMGLPLLIVGTAGGKLLPKAGAWMKSVETVFGVLFLGMAIWILNRIISPQITLLLWATLLIISAIYLGALSSTPSHGWGKLWKGSGVIMLVYGILMIVGAAQGNTNPFQPLSWNATTGTKSQENSVFAQVETPEAITAALKTAKTEGKPILLDFYAKWCVSCVEMEHSVFKDPAILASLSRFINLRADVTHNSAQDQKIMRTYQVIAPPTMLFFSANGELLKQFTLVGKVDASTFLSHLQSVLHELNNS